MPIKFFRFRLQLITAVLATTALLGFLGCNKSNSALAVTPTSLALSATSTSVNLG